jgi:hypothetical protein
VRSGLRCCWGVLPKWFLRLVVFVLFPAFHIPLPPDARFPRVKLRSIPVRDGHTIAYIPVQILFSPAHEYILQRPLQTDIRLISFYSFSSNRFYTFIGGRLKRNFVPNIQAIRSRDNQKLSGIKKMNFNICSKRSYFAYVRALGRSYFLSVDSYL